MRDAEAAGGSIQAPNPYSGCVVARVTRYWTRAAGMAVAHIDDDALEAYSMGRLAEADVVPIEEHLLVCAECQDRLAGWDEYIAAMRTAMRRLRAAARAGADS